MVEGLATAALVGPAGVTDIRASSSNRRGSVDTPVWQLHHAGRKLTGWASKHDQLDMAGQQWIDWGLWTSRMQTGVVCPGRHGLRSNATLSVGRLRPFRNISYSSRGQWAGTPTYIGQTGRGLRERLQGLAAGANGTEAPYNDPHTAAPHLGLLPLPPGRRFPAGHPWR
jgi:hypothetical protein